jgi:hypothetical protein
MEKFGFGITSRICNTITEGKKRTLGIVTWRGVMSRRLPAGGVRRRWGGRRTGSRPPSSGCSSSGTPKRAVFLLYGSGSADLYHKITDPDPAQVVKKSQNCTYIFYIFVACWWRIRIRTNMNNGTDPGGPITFGSGTLHECTVPINGLEFSVSIV